MEIKITKSEFRTLLEIIEMADWVLHAHKTEEPPETAKYREFMQKIYSYAKQFGYDELVVYEPKYKEYFVTRKYEDESPCMKFIEDFVNDSFWDELLERLARRDFVRQKGIEKITRMSPTECIRKLEPLRQKYAAEFSANGLNNITIKE